MCGPLVGWQLLYHNAAGPKSTFSKPLKYEVFCSLLLTAKNTKNDMRCGSERLAGARVAAALGAEAELTFAPAICGRSLRLALLREIRQLRDRLPASARLAAPTLPDGPTAAGAKRGRILLLMLLGHSTSLSIDWPAQLLYQWLQVAVSCPPSWQTAVCDAEV